MKRSMVFILSFLFLAGCKALEIHRYLWFHWTLEIPRQMRWWPG